MVVCVCGLGGTARHGTFVPCDRVPINAPPAWGSARRAAARQLWVVARKGAEKLPSTDAPVLAPPVEPVVPMRSPLWVVDPCASGGTCPPPAACLTHLPDASWTNGMLERAVEHVRGRSVSIAVARVSARGAGFEEGRCRFFLLTCSERYIQNNIKTR